MAGLSGLTGPSGLSGIMGGGSYIDKVLGYGPIAYWPLYEASGTTAACLVNAAQNGTYSSDVSTWPTTTGIGDGNTAPSFDGTNDDVNIQSAAFNTAFNGALFTISAWMKVSGVGVWTDGSERYVFHIGPNTTNNLIQIRKDSANNTLRCQLRSGGTIKTRDHSPINDTGWIHVACTVSEAADQFKFYVAGSQTGATLNGLGVWVGNLGATTTAIGAQTTAPTHPFSGPIAHLSVFGSVLSAPTIADLAVV